MVERQLSERASLAGLAADLDLESRRLEAILDELDVADWDRPTPARGFAVRDQVSHLAHFHEALGRAACAPEDFAMERERAIAEAGTHSMRVAERYRGLSPAALREWFTRSRQELLAVFATLDPRARVAWYGPDMAAATALSARIMETWAHGTDVYDTFGLVPAQTAALRHVADIGVRTFANGFRVRGLEVPAQPVRVELRAPDGAAWSWGPDDADNVVSGTAADFCLLVCQRRHRDDTAVSATGEIASRWLDVAQAFAGPPGQGRKPGQFPRA